MTDILVHLTAERQANIKVVREMILTSDHPDREKIARDLDREIWENATGVAQAKATWAALSQTQRRVMAALGEGRALARCAWSRTTYNAVGDANRAGCHAIVEICRLPTVQNLVARGLIEVDSPSDPFKRFTLTTYGAFTLKRGTVS